MKRYDIPKSASVLPRVLGSTLDSIVNEMRRAREPFLAEQVRAPQPVRSVRAVAFDPLCSDGKRIHTILGFDPVFTLNTFIAVMNYAAGETVYAPEGGSAETAIHYTNSVPYQWVTSAYTPFEWDQAQPTIHLTGDEFKALRRSAGPWPYQSVYGNCGLGTILDPSYVGFTLVDDINAGKFDLLLFMCPGAGRDEGNYTGLAESYMLAAPDDDQAISTNGGTWRIPGIRHDRKVVLVMSNMTRGPDLTVHSWIHAHIDAGILRTIWNWPRPTDDVQQLLSPLDLWLANGDPTAVRLNGTTGIHGNAGAGGAHRNPNSFADYALADQDVVPTNADMWLTYPNGDGWWNGRLDLDKNDRRKPYSDKTWRGLTQLPEYCRCQAWQLRRIPRGAGKIDGRWADWWRYLLDPNDRTGVGFPLTKPVVGPHNGGRDLRLSVETLQDGGRMVTLTWDISQEDNPGVYAVVRWDAGYWSLVHGGVVIPTAHNPSRATFQERLPADGAARFYSVLWQAQGRARPLSSDALLVAPGTGSPSGGFQQVDVALYQGAVPYVTTQDVRPVVEDGTVRLYDGRVTELMQVPWLGGQAMYSLADERPLPGVSGYYLGAFDPKGSLIGWSDLVGAYRGASQV